MFINMSSQNGDGRGGIEEAIKAAIAQMMGGTVDDQKPVFDSGPFRQARNTLHRALEQDLHRMIESRSWDRVRWAEEILKIDPDVRGCCGQDDCDTDQAFRVARKRMGLWTTEEMVTEAVNAKIPAIAEAVEERLSERLPEMMEEAAYKALQKDRRNRWYNRAIRAMLGFVVEFLMTAFLWHSISTEIDKRLAGQDEAMKEAGTSPRKVKAMMIRHSGLAAMLGYYTGMLVGWTIAIAILAGLGWFLFDLTSALFVAFGLWTAVGIWTGIAVVGFALVLWINDDLRDRMVESVSTWWEYHITDTWDAFRQPDGKSKTGDEWWYDVALDAGNWFAHGNGWFPRSLRWIGRTYANRTWHPVAWVRSRLSKNTDAASTEE